MKKDQPSIMNDVMFKKHHKIYGRVVGITLACCTVLLGIGYGLDIYLGTKPAILITSLVIGFPLVQFIVYKNMMAFARKEVLKRKLNQK